MQTKNQISLTRKSMVGNMSQKRKTTLKLISIIIMTILFLGNSFPVSATTPADHGKSKPSEFTIWLPWRSAASSSLGVYLGTAGSYGEGKHQNQEYYALDFMLPLNENVYAIATGDVMYAGPTYDLSCGYGNVVMIDHVVGNEHYQSLYAHLSEWNVVTGQHIDVGSSNTPIGKVGNSSCDSGNPVHLHFALFQGASFPNGHINKINATSIVPEPFIGYEVVEGFGLPKNPKWRGPLIAVTALGNSADLSAIKWSSSASQDGSTIGKGQTIALSVDGLPSNVKEVRLTAYYPNWSNGLPSGWPEKVWRILARCWPNIGKSNCSWASNNTKLSYYWDPYSDGLQFDGDWWPSGSNFVNPAYNNSSPNQVCISFDVFDKAGNVAYAPNGVLCGIQGQVSNSFAENFSVSAQTDNSTRLIYVLPLSSPGENIPPSGSWSSPINGQTISSNTVTLTVAASDNAGGSGVREVRWAAKYGGQWYGIGTDYDSPYSINWDWCAAGVQNGDVELGFEVWDNANNKWVYSENGNVNIHINKNYNCDSGGGGSINWSTHFYNGFDHWWDPNNTNNQMCSGSFSQGNLDQNYGNGSPCSGGATDNWVGDYRATVNFLPGNYAFWVDHDDWLKLRVDGREIYSVNGVHSEWKCVDNGYLYLSGNHDVWAILAEQGGDARIKVEWSKNNGVCDLPGAFNKSSPLNGIDEQSVNPNLSWGEASGAKSYSYCIDTTNDNSCDNPNWYGANTATSVNISGLNPGTTYYWQVKAYSQGGAGAEANSGVWWSFTTQSPTPPFNLLMNSSFEEGTDSPLWWVKDAWTMPYSTFEWSSVFAHSGIRSVKISNNTANDARWTQTVNVLPNSTYRLSGWIKTENVAHTLENPINSAYDGGANLSVLIGYYPITPLFGTNDWTYTSMEFNSQSNTQITVATRVGMYGGITTGTAWFDDLKLVLLSTPTCYNLSTSVSPVGGIIYLNPPPNCNNGTQYIHGTVVQPIAYPTSGYTFSGWGGDASGSSNPAMVPMTTNKSVTATFTLNNIYQIYLPLVVR